MLETRLDEFERAAVERGRTEGLRQALIAGWQARFDADPEGFAKLIEGITQAETLARLASLHNRGRGSISEGRCRGWELDLFLLSEWPPECLRANARDSTGTDIGGRYMTPDAGLEDVRRIREKISRQFANDPEKLVQHYIELQEQYKERLRRGPEEVQAARGNPG